MAACSRCGEDNPERARFCLGCGQPLAGRCTGCGEENPKRARFCLACGRPLPPAGPGADASRPTAPPPVVESTMPERSRKLVTVVFSDVTGSTALAERLDPETIRTVMARYFAGMQAILEAHGGTVEKFIGDAVMAVFGIPAVHEDDALRAVRAVTEIRRETVALNRELEATLGVSVRFRTGVNTGEVVAGDAVSGQDFATGDTVNVAARLEQAAEPGEILLGDLTYRLVCRAVFAEPAGPLALKGKSEPVQAWRLLEGTPTLAGAGGGDRAPLIGRHRELSRLRSAFDRAVNARCGELVSVIGPAGIGKSRLIDEFVASLTGEATVVTGRCLSYGEGITFWPVQEAVKGAAGITNADSAAEARARIAALVSGDEHSELIEDRVSQALGLLEASASTQEIFWGTRRFLEALAGSRPVVAVFEDLHWAEPTFLDLVEYLAGHVRSSPVLVLCSARPDVLDVRPEWGKGEANVTSFEITPLAEVDSGRLVAHLLGERELPEETHRCVAVTAEGNPLFIQEVLRMLVDEGHLRQEHGTWQPTGDLVRVSIPPSLETLLLARLDRLDRRERSVLQRGAVIGRVFWWGAVAELSPEEERAGLGRWLQSLVRKELIVPDQTTFVGEDAFRFLHILARDAAYKATSKEKRAELHERFATWLEGKAGDRIAEYEEIVGYHLEQAHRLRRELGPIDSDGRTLADRAAARLAAAGRRALARGDGRGAANLSGRAVTLWPLAHPGRVEAAIDLCQARYRAGDWNGAQGAISDAIAGAQALGDRRLEWHAVVFRSRMRIFTDPEGAIGAAERTAESALEFFSMCGDERGLTRAFDLLGLVRWLRGRAAEAEAALRQAIEHDRAAGGREEHRILGMLAWLIPSGPTPVMEALERCATIAERTEAHPSARYPALVALAFLEAMRGHLDESRRLIDDATALSEEFSANAAPLSQARGRIALLAGRADEAEAELRHDCQYLEEEGDKSTLSTSAACLAQALVALGRDDEAEAWSVISEEMADADDVLSQVIWRGARAKILARRGAGEAAERLAREAVARAETTDWLNLRGDAHLDLARVLGHLRRKREAAAAAQESLRLYQEKGNDASGALALAVLAEVG